MSNLEALFGESLVHCQSVKGASATASANASHTDSNIDAETPSTSTGATNVDSGSSLVPVRNIIGKDKIIGLFFSVAPENGTSLPSTSSCVPGSPHDCHKTLLEFYINFKKTPAGKNLEIVFVSADDDEDFDEPIYLKYLSEMPWVTFPQNDRQKQVSF